MATISHRNYRPPTRRAGGPRSTLSPSISPPRSTAKTRIPRAKVKREGPRTLSSSRNASRPPLSLSLSLHSFPLLSYRHDRYPSRYTHLHLRPTRLPVEESKRRGMNPFLRVATKRERERERRIVSRDRLLRGTTVSDSSIELVGLVALSAFPPPLTFAEPHSG